MPSVIPSIFSLLISRIHSSLFSDWRRTLLSKFFDTQIPSISTEELVFPLISLELAESRILAGPADTSYLIAHCPATGTLRRSVFGNSLSLYDLWSRPRRVVRLLGLHGFPLYPIPRKESGNDNCSNHKRNYN